MPVEIEPPPSVKQLNLPVVESQLRVLVSASQSPRVRPATLDRVKAEIEAVPETSKLLEILTPPEKTLRAVQVLAELLEATPLAPQSRVIVPAEAVLLKLKLLASKERLLILTWVTSVTPASRPEKVEPLPSVPQEN